MAVAVAVAVSAGRVTSASASAEQTSNNLIVNKNAAQTEQITSPNGSFSSAGAFMILPPLPAYASGCTHSGGGHNRHDSYGKHNGNDTHSGGGNDNQPLSVTEAGTFDLAGVWAQQVLASTG